MPIVYLYHTNMHKCTKVIFTLFSEEVYYFKNITNYLTIIENYPNIVRIFSNFLF